MSQTYDVNENKTINIPFPANKLGAYLSKIKVRDGKKLTVTQRRMIFITVIKDFLSGSLSLDEMSEIAGYLWSILPSDRSDHLAHVLLDCAELNYYVRHIGDNPNPQFVTFMKKVMQYFKKYEKYGIE